MLNHDNFTFAKRALLVAKSCLDLTQVTSCTGFAVEGSQPPNTDRRFVFKVGDNFYYFKNQVPTQFDFEISFDNVLRYGNTAAELLAVNNLHFWLGKKIFPVIALYSEAADAQPRVKLGVKVSSFNDIFTCSTLSPVFEINNSKILSIAVEKNLQGAPVVNCRARLKLGDSWGDWQDLSLCKNQKADAVQFSADYVFSKVDGSQAARPVFAADFQADSRAGTSALLTKHIELPTKLFKAIDQPIFDDDIFVPRAEIKSVINKTYAPAFDADAITQTDIKNVLRPGNLDFADLKALSTFALIEHSMLADSIIKAYVCYLDKPEHFSGSLGTATGYLQSFDLEKDFIDLDTLQVQANGENILPVNFDSALALLQVQAPKDAELTISFDYNTPQESWSEMQVFFQDDLQTCFIHQTTAPKQFVALKFVEISSSGVTSQILKPGLNVLQHAADLQDISCAGNWRLFSDKILFADSDCLIDYSWHSKPVSFGNLLVGFI